MRLGIIIQARMGSSRLPGKVLRPIAGRPLLGHILDRLQQLQTPAQTIVATSTQPLDNVIAEFCHQRGTQVYRGSESNVLERYVLCAEHFKLDQVVRLTADNPFVDVSALDELIAMHVREINDFTQSFATLPIGVGGEIISSAALRLSLAKATEAHQFEHVDEFILENPQLFRCGALRLNDERNQPHVRLTVDTEEDWVRVCRVAESDPTKNVTTEEAIRLCLRSA